jgi:hypothetical protein
MSSKIIGYSCMTAALCVLMHVALSCPVLPISTSPVGLVLAHPLPACSVPLTLLLRRV